MTLTSHQPPTSHPGPLPQVIASYATYLRVRTGITPSATVTDDQAELILDIDDKTLLLAFGYRRQEWSLRSAEVRNREQATTFTCGQLADAVTALERP